ncbi:hypothetical protein [Burkholderia stagnalis]|uniref:hypothetical protein n=1 Tax=Burkholderia stagnalis TaxID=1503054 RepID=UPI000F5BAEA2|nr:hypothetical protein [Burkholderia stagnalis]RQP98861.1 hypothetical protein DF164_31130 [Burkholderia stagnalis]RQY64913.1 hypothetical protein DF110_30655 [Burkholderia stagnalis]
MSAPQEDRMAIVSEKVAQLRQELEALGFDCAFFYRAPGAAHGPVAYLLVGETTADVEAARAAQRP